MSYLLSILVEAKDEASSVLGSIGGAIAGVGKVGLAVAGAGVAALGGALVAAIGNAIDAQDVFAQTEAVVKSTGHAAGLSAQEMADLASSLSAASGKSKFGDEMILQGENVLATFTNIGKDVFPLATQASLDMAQAMHKTPEAMSMLLGKALSSAEGVSALRKMGVQFNDTQMETIKRLFETGHAAEAQKMILAELGNEFGGSALAAAQTFSGQLGTLKDKFGELLEGIGLKLLPVLTQFVGFLNSPEIQAGIQAFADAILNGIGQAATFIGPVLAEVGRVLGVLIGYWQEAREVTSSFAEAVGYTIDTLLGVGEGVVGPVQGAIQTIQAAFSDAKNPVQGLINVLAQISPTFALVKAGIDAALPPIQSIITSVFGIIGAFLTEHGAKIRSDLTSAWSQIQAIINQVTPAIQAIISTVFGAVAAFLQEHGAEISAFMAQTWDTIAQIISLALQLIQATIVPAIKAIAGFIAAHGTEIKTILEIAWGTIRTIITTVLGVIKGILTAALAAIKGDWSGAWTAIKGVAQTIWDGIKSLLQLNLQLITVLFKSTWDGIKAYFEGILNGLVGWVLQTMEGIKNAIVGFAGAARNAAGGVANAIVDGIAGGISDGASKIISAAKDAAMAALHAAESALGINSPSKVFREDVGHNVGAGMGLGITDQIPVVTKAGHDLAQAATDGAKDALNVGGGISDTARRNRRRGHGSISGGFGNSSSPVDVGSDVTQGHSGDVGGGFGGGTTVNHTQILNYTGIHQEEDDVRQAMRVQALSSGYAQ